MADFCKQCSLEMFGEDFRELAHLMDESKYDTENGWGAGVLCEGCGPTVVDYEGVCHAENCLKEHGKKS